MEDLRGKKFNKLTAISFNNKDKHGTYFWLFRCDCGNEKIMSAHSVKSGHAKTCGCGRSEKNITGMRFGRLVAIRKERSEWNKEKRQYISYWLFKCDCGNEKVINKYAVTHGRVLSCGCFAIQKTIEKNTKHGLFKVEKRLYRCWQDMKNRCYNEKIEKYKRYGGRGIKVCEEWKDNFEKFYDWATSNGYRNDLTLDRIDFNGNYYPDNCRWVTWKEQARNTSRNVHIEMNGEVKILTEWLKIYDIPRSNYYKLKEKGFSNEDIFIKGFGKRRKVNV